MLPEGWFPGEAGFNEDLKIVMKMKNIGGFGVYMGAALWLWTSVEGLAQSHNVREAGTGTNRYAQAVNLAGQVAGYGEGTNGVRAWLDTAGSVTDLGAWAERTSMR